MARQSKADTLAGIHAEARELFDRVQAAQAPERKPSIFPVNADAASAFFKAGWSIVRAIA